MSLCAPCQNLISKKLHWDIFLTSSPSDLEPVDATEARSPETFIRSVEDGCYICKRLFCNLTEHLQSKLQGLKWRHPPNEWYEVCLAHGTSGPPRPETKDGPPSVFLSYQMNGSRFCACLWFGEENDACAHFDGRIMNLSGRTMLGAPPGWRITSTSTASEETFTKIDSWLSCCQSVHMKCLFHRERSEKDWYPTRLVHISPLDGDEGEDLRMRILRGSALPEGSQYATLSHRWESSNMPKLTVSNLSSWTQSVPREILSRTFLDAARATKRLGVDYLWIDCLCIIQDGDELQDWKREAPTMQNVYSNAFFNICASWGPEIGGLFATRDPDAIRHAPLELWSKNAWKKDFLLVSQELFVGNHLAPVDLEDLGSWNKLVEQSPLASRGWAFQERLLATRNIYFCKGIVLYECCEQRWSESLGVDVIHWNPVVNGNFIERSESSPTIKTFIPTSRLLDRDYIRVYRTWYNLVEKYTCTELTFAEDRLAAVAGIAQRFRKVLKYDVYVAGLWLDHLSLDMLWERGGPLPSFKGYMDHPRPTQLTFSWIWVSRFQVTMMKQTDGGKEPDEKFTLPQITCVQWRARADDSAKEYVFSEDIVMIPSTPRIEIMVQGTLKRMMFRMGPTFDLHVFPAGVIAVPEPEQDLEALRKRGEWHLDEKRERGNALSVEAKLDFWADETEIASLNGSGKIFYVPWYDNDESFWFVRPFMKYCILLELVSSEMGRFRRIGLLKFGQAYHELYFGSQSGEEDFPSWKYDQNTREHTFFIV